MKLIEARRIWDQAPHNAFPDLIRFAGRWLCVLREGASHVSSDGALRVIASADGGEWDSAAHITSPDSDLREARFSVAPDGHLMLHGAEALHRKSGYSHHSLVWISGDGGTWSDKRVVGEPGFWLWRVTWHRGRAYGIAYSCAGDEFVRLYRSDDGVRFVPLVDRLFDVGSPNESSIAFRQDTAYCLLRRDGEPDSGLLGTAAPPYTHWQWRDLGAAIGGPHMLFLPDGRLIAAVRLYDGEIRTALCRIDPETARLTELLALPSGGDTSYPGLALHDGLLWVSYYSSHEEKTAIYLAKVQIED